MLTFIRENGRWLSAGFLLTFASSFGQTWFISLFSSEIKLEFGLTDGSWGSLYTVATLSSALMMFWLGSLVDRIPLVRFAPAMTLVFAIAALGFSLSTSVALLGFFIFLLRFCGQGMFSHIAMTAMGRWFHATRGKAVSIANLGHPAAEVVVPLIAVFAIATIGWNMTWLLVALLLLFVVAPALWWLLSDDRIPQSGKYDSLSSGTGGKHWTRAEAVRHWLLPALVPMLLTPGFISTVVFFHQVHIASVKGWSLMEMAPGYTFFASATVGATFLMGWASDRFGADRLLPYILIPMGFGVLIIGLGASVWTWVYGANALWPHTRGVRCFLGRVPACCLWYALSRSHSLAGDHRHGVLDCCRAGPDRDANRWRYHLSDSKLCDERVVYPVFLRRISDHAPHGAGRARPDGPHFAVTLAG